MVSRVLSLLLWSGILTESGLWHHAYNYTPLPTAALINDSSEQSTL